MARAFHDSISNGLKLGARATTKNDKALRSFGGSQTDMVSNMFEQMDAFSLLPLQFLLRSSCYVLLRVVGSKHMRCQVLPIRMPRRVEGWAIRASIAGGLFCLRGGCSLPLCWLQVLAVPFHVNLLKGRSKVLLGAGVECGHAPMQYCSYQMYIDVYFDT